MNVAICRQISPGEGNDSTESLRYSYAFFSPVLNHPSRGSGEKKAYEYLRDSVESFPSPGEICLQMAGAGYINVEYERLVPGVAVLFTGQKRG
ncbi:MAG TPA: class I SAM-dependent methyltransferase [Bacteroidales bacterium]|nr:class I SAM-dependent methyltransferase [Bacteroidales bacterium]